MKQNLPRNSQKQNPFMAAKTGYTSAAKPSALTADKKGLWAVLVVVLLAGVWGVSKIGPISRHGGGFLLAWLGQDNGKGLFSATSGMNREDARKLYRQSLQELGNGDYQDALEHFKTLEGVYPGLGDFIAFHEADAYSRIPNESDAQNQLKKVMQQYPDSALKAIAAYQLAQSYFRARQADQAAEQFKRVQQEYPTSSYAVGSLYYLGDMALHANPPRLGEVKKFWFAYLRKAPDGRFNGDIAEQLDSLHLPLSGEEHGLLGVGYLNSQRSLNKAVAHLSQAIAASPPTPLQGGTSLPGEKPDSSALFRKYWFPLGKTMLQLHRNQEAVKALSSGLLYADSPDAIHEAVDLLDKALPDKDFKAILQDLSKQALPSGGDYLFWRLAQLDPQHAIADYKHVVAAYPKGDYAPESSWEVMWASLKEGRSEDFLHDADRHLRDYPYAQSSPKVMFWKARVYESKSLVKDALSVYRELSQSYPYSYYAYRARSRTASLSSGKPDEFWVLPSENNRFADIAMASGSLFQKMDASSVVGKLNLPPQLYAKAEELYNIGVGNDLALLVKETTGELPAVIAGWQLRQAGDIAGEIRVLRDDMVQKAMRGNVSAFKPDMDELKMMYPMPYTDLILKNAGRNKIDPFIIQSLMREESYFNPMAVSGSNAMGLMQLMSSTAGDVARWEGLPHFESIQLFVPETNIRLGSRYLKHLADIFQGNMMLAVGAYNGGPNAVQRWLQISPVAKKDPDWFIENIPYEQTRTYIKKVFGSYWTYKSLYE